MSAAEGSQLSGGEIGEIRSQVARRHLENVELWLRRLIHYRLSKAFGADFCRQEGLLKSEMRKRICTKFDRSPSNYSRMIDASTMEDAVAIVTNPKYKREFEPALRGAFPDGHTEARTFLIRLRDIRNTISHGRVCSSRDYERAICYSNDVIDSLREFFKDEGMSQVFNAPFFTRYKNNLGLDIHYTEVNVALEGNTVFYSQHGFRDVVPGERVIVEVEVDPSFDPSTYRVTWNVQAGLSGEGLVADFVVTNAQVGQTGFRVDFELYSKQGWYRFARFDDSVRALYRALPPPA